jgi:hypothetical protein
LPSLTPAVKGAEKRGLGASPRSARQAATIPFRNGFGQAVSQGGFAIASPAEFAPAGKPSISRPLAVGLGRFEVALEMSKPRVLRLQDCRHESDD